MSLVTANEVDVLSGSISMPLEGVWSADLVLDQPDGSGFSAGTQVSISAGGLSLSGVVAPDRTGSFLDAVHVRVLGGRGGLSGLATPRAYVQPGAYVRDVLSGLLGAAGETLAASSDATFQATNLLAWSVFRVPVSQALEALIGAVSPGLHWRVLADGTVWVGAESWPAAAYDYELLVHDPAQQTYELGVESPAIVPGVTIDGLGQVSRVEHLIEANSMRTRVYVSDADRSIKAAVYSLARQAVAGVDYFALYDAKVISQSGNSLDLQPLDSRLPGFGGVPLRIGIPGVTATVQPGCVVRLGWDRGDPQRPFCCLFDASATALSLSLSANSITLNNGTLPVARQTDTVTGQAGPYTLANGMVASGNSTVKA